MNKPNLNWKPISIILAIIYNIATLFWDYIILKHYFMVSLLIPERLR